MTLPNNFVTAWNTIGNDLRLALPWPKPATFTPQGTKNPRILVWGGSSSVGQYVLQILTYYGYDNLIATASPRNFSLVRKYGATHVLSHTTPTADITKDIEISLGGKLDLVLDCIGSLPGSVEPISGIVGSGAKVAIMLPVIVRDASEEVEPEYAMDVGKVVDWQHGVEIKGVRTHNYLDVSTLPFNLRYYILRRRELGTPRC